MTTYALITEGITDQVVLDTIIQEIHSHHNKGDEADVRPLQPPRDATDAARAGDFGGWEKVLEHCSLDEVLSETLALNEFLVIQIDTDACEHVKFGVAKTQFGVARPVSDMINDTAKLLRGRIGEEILKMYQDRIIFAICVHSIECWLLPLHAVDGGRGRTLECEAHLHRELARKGFKTAKNYNSYLKLAKPFSKIKNINAAAAVDGSLMSFVNAIEASVVRGVGPQPKTDLPEVQA